MPRTARHLEHRRLGRLTRYGLQTILHHAMATVVDGDFEWDEGKAAANLVKHHVSFA
jgi:hypothetical protein